MTECVIELNELQCRQLALGIGDIVTISNGRTIVFNCEDDCPLLLSDSEAYKHGRVVGVFLKSEVNRVGHTTYNITYDILYGQNNTTGDGASKLSCHISLCTYILPNLMNFCHSAITLLNKKVSNTQHPQELSNGVVLRKGWKCGEGDLIVFKLLSYREWTIL